MSPGLDDDDDESKTDHGGQEIERLAFDQYVAYLNKSASVKEAINTEFMHLVQKIKQRDDPAEDVNVRTIPKCVT